MIIICYSSLGEFLVSNVCLFFSIIKSFSLSACIPILSIPYSHLTHVSNLCLPSLFFFIFFSFHPISLTLIGVNVIPYLSSLPPSPLLSSFRISKTNPKTPSRLVRESIPEAVIGLFVHTPFPSSEVFRCLPS